MRKALIATTTACLLTAALTGCGDPSKASQTADQLEDLLDKMSQIDNAAAPLEGNKQAYTKAAQIEGVSANFDIYHPDNQQVDKYIALRQRVAGQLAQRQASAAYIDQAITLLPQAEKIAQDGTDQQKKAANTIIASILADEGAYLIGISQSGYQRASNDLSDLHERINLLEEIVTLSRDLSGDRAEEIDTYRTGKVDANTSVQGINQHAQQAGSAKEQAQTARADLAKLTAKIDELSDKVAEYESLELKLSNEALGAEGKVRFEKLDQATSAWQEAQNAEAQAETLARDAAVKNSQARLAEVRQAGSEAVAEELEAKIDQIEAEKRLIADKLAQLNADRQATVKALSTLFSEMDAKVQELGFDRMAKAQQKLEGADKALASANLGVSGELEVLSVYLLRARSLHQQSLAARSYSALLLSLSASGPEVLGSDLHKSMTQRIKQVNAVAAKASTDAGKLNQDAGSFLSTLQNSADAASEEGKATLKQVNLYSSLMFSIKPQGGGPTGGFNENVGAPADSLLGTWRQEINEINGQPLPQALVMDFTFKDGGVLEIGSTGPGGEKMTITGSYSVSGDQISFKMPAELGGEEESGTYQVSGNTLTLTSAEDGEVMEMTRQ